MSYGATAALQAAVFARLSADPNLGALVSGNVFDAIPPGPLPALYVSLGPEKVRDASDNTGAAASHDFAINVMSDQAGFLGAKEAAAAVSDALLAAPLEMTRGRVVTLSFQRARARKSGAAREIEIWFRAFVDDAA